MIVVDNNSWYVNSMSLTRKKLLHYISLLFSTIVIIFLFVYQLYSSDIKAMFFKTSNGQFKTETQSEYYKRINKTDRQITYDHLSTIGVNILQVTPVIGAILTRNALMYVTYSGAIVITAPVIAFTKKFIKEARPDDDSSLTSFPSGHALFAFLSATIYTLYAAHRYKQITSICAFLLATFVAIGRVMAKRHWCIDVICGGIIGIAIAMLTTYIVHKMNSHMFQNQHN